MPAVGSPPCGDFAFHVRGVRHPAVHDPPQRQPAQAPQARVRLLAAGPGALAVPDPGRFQQPHRRRVRCGRLPVAAGAARTRGSLPRTGFLAARVGRRPARRRHLRRHGGRRGRAGTGRAGGAKPLAGRQSRSAAARPRPPLRRLAAAGLQQHRRRRCRPATACRDRRHRRSAGTDRQRPRTALRHRPGGARRRRPDQHQTGHRRRRAVEPADSPAHPRRRVRLARGGSGAPCVGSLHGRGQYGRRLSVGEPHPDVGVRHIDGVDVRHRPGDRLLAVHPDEIPRGATQRA